MDGGEEGKEGGGEQGGGIEEGKERGNEAEETKEREEPGSCLLYTSPSPRDRQKSRMPSSA